MEMGWNDNNCCRCSADSSNKTLKYKRSETNQMVPTLFLFVDNSCAEAADDENIIDEVELLWLIR
jgi:hypothetical protein